ncbi:hypothetical protein E2C01_030772 [Portunus trituberculatus]|uniref:Uncharacterized protein n=1 Tax=Portunus trituberculatus TaxID=210409 RepID=A0A5B7EW74_PORTR|nr:hypothetical protein [Portunus trituberculatus]
MLTKRRLKNLSSHYSCPDPAFDYSLELDIYENTINIHCTTCNFKNTSQPEKYPGNDFPHTPDLFHD